MVAKTCTFVDFVEALKPWLKDDLIKQASFDRNGKFTVLFEDGATNIYQIDDCSPNQIDEAAELMRNNGVLFLE